MIGVLDLGTTSVRFLLFNKELDVISSKYETLKQYYPRPGWVEEDPDEIWDKVCKVVCRTYQEEGVGPTQIAAIGLCNQRESVLLWDKKSKRPLTNLIVWQDRRTAKKCKDLTEKGYGPIIKEKTGLIIDAYFSATKLEWLFRELDRKQDIKNIAAGTLDSWILFKLTGRHLTDASNASRTMLYNIFEDHWDAELLDLFGVPGALLPEVLPTYGDKIFGHTHENSAFKARIPVCAVFGDQQSALFGQQCFEAGSVKSTYGTGSFIMASAGTAKISSANNLISTIYYKTPGHTLYYGLEGSIYNAGSLFQWLKDDLGILKDYAEIEKIASGPGYQDDLFVVPAFTGLGAPYWDSYARGTIIGIMRSTGRAQIVRACIDSIAYRTKDVIDAMQKDCGKTFEALRIDGGVSQNGLFCQVLADITGLKIIKSSLKEITALGTCFAAGLGIGIWERPEYIQTGFEKKQYLPQMDADRRSTLYARWQEAVARSRDWAC